MYSFLLGSNSYVTKWPQPDQSVQQPLGSEMPLERFFLKYPKFQSQPSNSPVVEFDRLCKFYNWEEDDPESGKLRAKLSILL
jgi:hypothetical protein